MGHGFSYSTGWAQGGAGEAALCSPGVYTDELCSPLVYRSFRLPFFLFVVSCIENEIALIVAAMSLEFNERSLIGGGGIECGIAHGFILSCI